MSRPVLAIRPEPGCTATVAVGRSIGLEIRACPLFEVRPVAWSSPSRDEFDGLLLGSANAVRHAGPALESFAGLPVYAVGRATTEAAEAAGFPVAICGQGGLQSVLDSLAGKDFRLLRLAGAERIELYPPSGVTIETRTVYETVELPLPDSLANDLQARAVVLLHSAAAARHFASECERCGVARGGIALAALGPRIAEAAGPGWRDVRASFPPTDAALLALAFEMCHDFDEK